MSHMQLPKDELPHSPNCKRMFLTTFNKKGMKTPKFYSSCFFLALMLCVCHGCGKGNETECGGLTFSKERAVRIDETNLTPVFDVPLDTASQAVVYPQARMRMGKEGFFVFTREALFLYNPKGAFLRKIGQQGRAANEYLEIVDVALDEPDKCVEILGPQKIYTYGYDGRFLHNKDLPISACSFIHAEGRYWVCNGRTGNEPQVVFVLDDQLKQRGAFLDGKADIPIMEDNFGRAPVQSFHESFTHDIYHMDGDSLRLAYVVESPGLEIPEDLFKGDPMEIMQKMQSNDCVVIKSFLENERYIYMLVQEYAQGSEGVRDYHWVIDKRSGKERVVDVGIPANGSFHDNPQLLTADNIVYFLGYPIVKDSDSYNPEENPHIIGLDLSKIVE